MFRFIRVFLAKVDGGATAFALFFLGAGLLISSYAVDESNLQAQMTLLQATADAAAHDALVTRELRGTKEANAAAILRTRAMMPPGTYGDVLKPEDIVFGTWDGTKRKFAPSPSSRSAVRVTLRRTAENGNSVLTYLMKLAGIRRWDVVLNSTFSTYQPDCLTEGFAADGLVDVQSNNNLFCIHSNSYVSINSNNVFDPGSILSMPDLSRLNLPMSGYNTNSGLSAALKAQSINIRVLKRLQQIISGVSDTSSPYYPPFLTDPAPIVLSKSRIGASDLASGRVYIWKCNDLGGGTIDGGTLINGVVIIANCDVKLGTGSAMEDAILVTTSTSNNSIVSPSGFRLGRNDNCVKGGGGRIVSMGGMHFAANLEIYGSQLLAKGNVSFAARADGIKGASVISNGQISGTSNMSMAHCKGGMDEFTAAYFQMVQ